MPLLSQKICQLPIKCFLFSLNEWLNCCIGRFNETAKQGYETDNDNSHDNGNVADDD
jgi:hypothetical protein